MADKKISALTAASTPLAGTEVLPVVQSSSTVKVSVANLTAGRDVAMQSFEVSMPYFDPTVPPKIRTGSSSADPILEWNRWTGVGTNYTGARFIYDGTDFKFANAPSGSIGSLSFTTRMEIGSGGDIKANTGNVVMGTAGKGIDFSANSHAAGMTSELLNWYEEGTWTPTYSGWTINPTNVFAKYTRVGRLVTLNFTAENGVSLTGSSEIGGLPFASNSQQGASVLMKDIVGSNISAFGSIGASVSAVQSITSATFTGVYWSFSVTYMV